MVAAFQYGASVLERAKQQRAAKGATAFPKWLEESVVDAPDEIEREKRRGLERFGRDFEIGDDQAIFALQQITIQLQCSLLMKIHNLEDQTTDYKALARAADTARDNTMTTLMQLRKRLQQAEIEGDMSKLSISTELTPPPPPPKIISDAREVTMSPTVHSGTHDNIPAFRRQPLPPARRESAAEACHSATGYRDSGYDTLSPAPSHNSDQQRRSTVGSVHSESQSIHFNQAPDTMRAHSTAFADLPSRTTITTTNMPSSQLAKLPKPDRKNNYLGFCKCAWRLQCGDEKAFIKSKDWSQRSAASDTYSLACDRFRCEFKSPFKSSGNPNVIWNKLIVSEEHGIKYRWSFLAKSHVTQKNVVNEDYSFQCQFCVSMGLQVPVMNLAMLLEHIGTEHRRHAMSDVILDRTGCVNDRICRDGEKFDINLYPPIHGVEADAFISPVPGDVRESFMRTVQPVEKYGEAKSNVYELYA